ncbi:hypothetical protein D1BOALGB6SA_9587 [Olavius sp. associated proteobacterium Delta 1]|nr:hypothetical protein D1BOALGB6SA_9587 [Olavius sp. associated proteobacterium Delta 1]
MAESEKLPNQKIAKNMPTFLSGFSFNLSQIYRFPKLEWQKGQYFDGPSSFQMS